MRASLGRITVDQQLYEGYTVPLGQRSASPGMRTAGRGTRLPLPEGETIRFFLHWRDLPEAPPKAPRPAGPAAAEDRDTRVDLDLSAFFVSEDFTRTEQIAYYNLRSTAAVHSGDLTSAPDGAAEFIDVTLAEALHDGGGLEDLPALRVRTAGHRPRPALGHLAEPVVGEGVDRHDYVAPFLPQRLGQGDVDELGCPVGR